MRGMAPGIWGEFSTSLWGTLHSCMRRRCFTVRNRCFCEIPCSIFLFRYLGPLDPAASVPASLFCHQQWVLLVTILAVHKTSNSYIDVPDGHRWRCDHSQFPLECFLPGISVIMTIRVWALWGRRRDIGILLLTMVIVGIAVSCTTYTLLGSSRCKYECCTYSWRNVLMTTLGLDIMMGSFSLIIPGCFPVIVSTVSWAFIPLCANQTRKY